MKLTRRSVLASSVGAPLLAWGPGARAADFEMKWGLSAPASHPLAVHAAEAIKNIQEESKGRIRIQLFPASQLGGDTDMLSQLRAGALDIYTNSPAFLSSLAPTAGIVGLGFAFKDYQTVWRAVDGDVGAIVRDAASGVNIHVFEKFWDFGFHQLTNSVQPITSVAGLQGMKIRVAVIPLYFSMFKALGAAPVSMNVGELYTALQTKLVQGQETPLGIAYATKLFEVQKFVALTNHIWEGTAISANKRSFAALPADVRDVLSRHINESGVRQREAMQKQDAEVRGKFEAAGLKFNEIDTTPFREKLKQAGYYQEWKTKFGAQAWTSLEKYCGQLG